MARSESHDECFSFKHNFVSFCKSFVPDFENLHCLLTLNATSNESTLFCDSCKTLGNDLKVSNETCSKNDNEFFEKNDIQGHLNEKNMKLQYQMVG